MAAETPTPTLISKLIAPNSTFESSDFNTQDFEAVAAYCAKASPTELQQIRDAMRQQLEKTKEQVAIKTGLLKLQTRISGIHVPLTNRTVGGDTAVIVKAAAEGLQKATVKAGEAWKFGKDKVGAPVVQFAREEWGTIASDVDAKNYGGAAGHVAILAGAGLGIFWAWKKWKEAIWNPIPPKEGKKDSFLSRFFGRSGKILKALGCTALTLTGIIAVKNGMAWTKEAIANSDKTPTETPSTTSTDVPPGAKAPDPQSAEKKVEGQKQTAPSPEKEIASKLKELHGKDLYASFEVTKLSINGNKLEIGKKNILINDKSITISAKLGEKGRPFSMPLLHARADDSGNLNLDLVNPRGGDPIKFPLTPGKLVEIVGSITPQSPWFQKMDTGNAIAIISFV